MEQLYDVRKSARAATNHLAGLKWRRGLTSARVLDMSITGARLATHEPIMVDEVVILNTVRMGARPGVVVRVDDGEIAIRFTDDLAADFEARSNQTAP